MRERLQFLFIYLAFWTLYFLSAKVIFLAYHIQDTKILTLETLWGIFSNGFRLDLSMAAYLSILPFLLVAFSNWIKKSIFERVLFGYTLFLVFIVTLLVVIDLEVFNVWKFRLDDTPLYYLSSPKEAWASVKSSPILRLILSYILLLVFASYIVYRIIASRISTWKYVKNSPFVWMALGLTVSLFIPIRGGFQKERLTESKVYFSDTHYANIASLNTLWHFTSSVFFKSPGNGMAFQYLPTTELQKQLDELFFESKDSTELWLRSGQDKPNILLVVWESLGNKLLELENSPVPHFQALTDSVLFYSNMFASGDRTEKALVSIFSNFPGLPTQSIINETEKTKKLPFLSHELRNVGYKSEFYYGGDADFANMKPYLLQADFDLLIDKFSFPSSTVQGTWGIHDEELFAKFLKDHSQVSLQPFFSTILTVSSHQPYEVPKDYDLKEEGEEREYFNAMRYTDDMLHDFLQQAKNTSWWKNTLVIITGDHGHHLPYSGSRFNDYKVPFIVTGGAVTKKGQMVHPVSQADIAKTILSQLKVPSQMFSWSKDFSHPFSPKWAYFLFNNGFGFVEPNSSFLFDNIGNKIGASEGKVSKLSIDKGKALQQGTYLYYLEL